jgi:hypothetical protein
LDSVRGIGTKSGISRLDSSRPALRSPFRLSEKP